MLYPKSLETNSIIGVTAPSEGILDKEESFDRSMATLENRGYFSIITKNVRTSGLVSSPAKTRWNELKALFENPQVDLVLCASGGDFLNEMLPFVDYQWLGDHPKWIQGYSDPTGLLFGITTNCDMATVYGPNGGGYDMRRLHKSLEDNLEILQGNLTVQRSSSQYQSGWGDQCDGYELDQETYWKTPHGPVDVTGRMIGGCMDVLLELVGTPYENAVGFVERYKEDGIIWYFDVFALSAEVFARGLWQLKEAGWFAGIRGIVLGRVRFPSSQLEMSYEEAIDRVMPNIPLITQADIGHVKPSMTIINGAMGRVKAKGGTGEIHMWFKE